MEKFVEQTLLFDFYGELLTAHQRRIYEHLVEKFVNIKGKVRSINRICQEYEELSRQELVSQVERISQEILEEL